MLNPVESIDILETFHTFADVNNKPRKIMPDIIRFYGIIHTKRTILFLLPFFTLSVLAQTEESNSIRRKEKWAIDGAVMWLAPDFDYYDKNLERYNPPAPWFWFGTSSLNSGLMGDHQAQFHLRSGVFNKLDLGCTIIQFSRNLYRGIIGVSAGLQFGAHIYDVSHDYSAVKNGYHVEFVPSEEEHKSDSLSFAEVRIPLLIGAQTNNRLFSLQSGITLCHTSRFGAQWQTIAGLGPITISYSQNLTPLFKLPDGTKAYPSSFTVGVDIWYLLCRFTHPKEQ